MLYITCKREDTAQHEVKDSVTFPSLKSPVEDYITLTYLRVTLGFSFNFVFPLEDIALLFLRTLVLKLI